MVVRVANRHDGVVQQPSGATVWEWQLADGDGQVLAPEPTGDPAPRRGFPSRSDAETWLGEHWRRLATAGAATARLLEDGQQVGAEVELQVAAEVAADD